MLRLNYEHDISSKSTMFIKSYTSVLYGNTWVHDNWEAESMTLMHLSMFSAGGVGGVCVCVGGGVIPWGLDSQSSHYPKEFDRQLWHGGTTLDVSPRKSRRNYV